MIRRVFWLGTGAALGIYMYRRCVAVLRSLTPSGLVTRAARNLTSGGLREIAGTVRTAAAEREAQLRREFALEGPALTGLPARPQLPPRRLDGS